MDLSRAEFAALQRILRRHGDAMSRFEKDLLTQVLRRDQRRRDYASQGLAQGQGGHPSRFVWTDAELRIVGRANRSSHAADEWWPDASSDVDAISALLEPHRSAS